MSDSPSVVMVISPACNAVVPIDRVGSLVDAYESWPDPFISLMPLAFELSGRLGFLATRFFELVQDDGRALVVATRTRARSGSESSRWDCNVMSVCTAAL